MSRQDVASVKLLCGDLDASIYPRLSRACRSLLAFQLPELELERIYGGNEEPQRYPVAGYHNLGPFDIVQQFADNSTALDVPSTEHSFDARARRMG